ncbi:hypothetical protein F4782DRAFT_552920 [Xylaria castorea]|nr:hypothetical protein F4782DRAFT_552920 [Xylaria castorea]
MKRIKKIGLHLPEQAQLPRFEGGMVASRLQLGSEGHEPETQSSLAAQAIAGNDDTGTDKGENIANITKAVKASIRSFSPNLVRFMPAETPSSVGLQTTVEGNEGQSSPSIREPSLLQRRNQASLAIPTHLAARVERLRKMAGLYERLAELHREEAWEYILADERAYADEVEKRAWGKGCEGGL